MKKIALIAATAYAALALAACGSTEEKAPPPKPNETKAPATEADIAAFKEKVDKADSVAAINQLRLGGGAPTPEMDKYAADRIDQLNKERLTATK